MSHNTTIKIEAGTIQSPTVETAQKIAIGQLADGFTLDELTTD